MASVSPVDLRSLSIDPATNEKELSNFYEIAWLLVNVGTVELRKIFDQMLDNEPLKDWIPKEHASHKGSLMRYQWEKSGVTKTPVDVVDNADSFDLSMLAALIRVCCNKKRPLNMRDQELSDISEDLKDLRNDLFAHVPHLEMSNDQYEEARCKLEEIFKKLNVSNELLKVPFRVFNADKLRGLEQHMHDLMMRFDNVDLSIDDILRRLLNVDESVDDFMEYVDSILAEILSNQRTHGQHLEESLSIQRDILVGQREIRAEQEAIKATIEKGPSSSKFGDIHFNDVASNVQIGDGNVMIINQSSFRGSISSNNPRKNAPRSSSSGSGTSSKKNGQKKPIYVSNAEVSREDMIRVSEAISDRDGVRLARVLRLDDPVIDNIKATHGGSGFNEVPYRLLCEWHEREGKDATLKVLADALVRIGRVAIAQLLGNVS